MYKLLNISSLRGFSLPLAGGALLAVCACTSEHRQPEPPNVLILMSDNQCAEHTGCYGDPVVRTPHIDSLAVRGVRFVNAFCSAPSCAPARAALLTGQDIWRLEEGANLWGALPAKFEVFTDLLAQKGYRVGYEGKGWGPGSVPESGRDHNPAGVRFSSFNEFMDSAENGKPFFYWFSSRSPHRPFAADGGKKAGIKLDKIVVPPYLPDNNDVRGDIADYYAEVQNFDDEVGRFVDRLRKSGKLENTVIIVCSDNGWQMPRGLANLYDMGSHVPLIMSMPARFKSSLSSEALVLLGDLAPTLLELAGIRPPEYMTAKSLLDILEGRPAKEREFVVTARERHAYVRKGGAGYGGRAIRTKDYLYIKNYEPEQWPAGDPPLYGDVDANMLHYPCPTKMYMLKNQKEAGTDKLFGLAFGMRPAEELYDLRNDPFQMENVAQQPGYKEVRDGLNKQLISYLISTGDPREIGGEMKWAGAGYYADKDKKPRPSKEAIEALGLEEVYTY